MTKEISPIIREIIANRVNCLTQEMGYALVRTAHNIIMSEDRDFSCCIFDHKGEVLGLATFVALHQGGQQGAMDYVKGKWGLDNFKEGDVFMHNDGLHNGTHPGDVSLIKPVFYKGTLVGLCSSVVHHADMGGMGAETGVSAKDAEDIYQEGLRFPGVKLFDKGELRQDILDIFTTNIRPVTQLGDLYGQLGTFTVAERGMKELCGKYGGAEMYNLYTDAIQDYTEARMREGILKIPEGSYEAEDYEDHDGWEEKSWKIKVKVTVKHSPEPKLIVDFTGSDPQAKGPINSNFSNTRAGVWPGIYAIVDPTIHKCYGCARPVEIIAPEGTIVNVKPGGAIGFCTTETGLVIPDLIVRALAKARPEATTGTWGGLFGAAKFRGENPRHLKHPRIPRSLILLMVEGGATGGGARATKDGMGVVTGFPCGSITMPNIEVMEVHYPFLYRYRRLRMDSGGPGKFRGSDSIEYLIEPEGSGWRFLNVTNRGYHGPPGVFGGKPGKTAKVEAREGKTDKTIRVYPPKCGNKLLGPGEAYYVATPGGGGYGNPWERDVEKVREDVIERRVSITGAKEDYGVVIDPETFEIDMNATERIRNEMRRG
jgi:N-methylhydantoinase B